MTGGFPGRPLSSLIRTLFFLKVLLCQPQRFSAGGASIGDDILISEGFRGTGA
jgi:hypothetical protein